MKHIHNGDVVAAIARQSDIPGEHLVFRESLITGPIADGDWIEMRAHAIAEAHGEVLLRVRTSFVEQEQTLEELKASDDEVVLWFEHDLYCLVHLVYLLQRIGGRNLSLVWNPQPLAESDEGDLHLLFESRTAVTPQMIVTAREVWSALTEPDPRALNRWFERDTADFPFLREGLQLHASRFPSVRNGVGAIEQRVLELISTGTSDFASLFGVISSESPRFGFGDGEVFRLLRAMAWCTVPLVTFKGDPPKTFWTITPAGISVLAAEMDNLAMNDPDAWLGGVHLTGTNLWRWDGNVIREGRS